MLEGRRESDWTLQSSLMALIANCHRSKGRSFKPDDFNPTAQKRIVTVNSPDEFKRFFRDYL